MRKILIASAVFFLLFFYGLILSQTRVSVIPDELEPKNATGFYDYRGISNVHSDRGLGSGSSLDVIRAAQEANLDYVILTDLNAFGEPPIGDSYHRKLLFISAAEYSYLDSRLLLFDLEKTEPLSGLGQAQLFLADVLSQPEERSQTSPVILAHPLKTGYQWKGSSPPGLDGIEVVNLKSLWKQAWEKNKLSFLWSAIVYPFNSDLALLRLYHEPSDEIELWDQLSQSRRTVGVAGAEATAKTSPIGDAYLRFPSYLTSFSFISNHVMLQTELTGQAEGDRTKIIKALGAGQVYMSLDVIGKPKGFSTYVEHGDTILPMGAVTKFKPGMHLIVHLPAKPKVPFEIVVFKDGQRFATSNEPDAKFPISEAGVYRVNVRTLLNFTLIDGGRWTTWIYANPFYLRKDTSTL